MGYNYELNIKAEIYPNVYTKALRHIVENYQENDEWDSVPSDRREEQYIWVRTHNDVFFFQSYEVIGKEGPENNFFISQNASPLKSGETTNIFTLHEEVVQAKENIEEFLKEVGFDESFSLKSLNIGYTEQNSPFMK